MKKISFLGLALLLIFSSCETFRPQEELSTVPSTNNPNIIIDPCRGSNLGSPEY